MRPANGSSYSCFPGIASIDYNGHQLLPKLAAEVLYHTIKNCANVLDAQFGRHSYFVSGVLNEHLIIN